MGTIIAFPADAAARRLSTPTDGAPREGKKNKGKNTKDKNTKDKNTKDKNTKDLATILILPVVRIERNTDKTSGGSGPEEGTAPGRRRRRRT
jgi:hypothetical protein